MKAYKKTLEFLQKLGAKLCRPLLKLIEFVRRLPPYPPSPFWMLPLSALPPALHGNRQPWLDIYHALGDESSQKSQPKKQATKKHQEKQSTHEFLLEKVVQLESERKKFRKIPPGIIEKIGEIFQTASQDVHSEIEDKIFELHSLYCTPKKSNRRKY